MWYNLKYGTKIISPIDLVDFDMVPQWLSFRHIIMQMYQPWAACMCKCQDIV